jgi:hypothetical protein
VLASSGRSVALGYCRCRRRAVRAALLIVALVITLRVNVPIDGAIDRWTVDTLPSDWTSIRNRWEAYHAARTFISLAGFGFVLAAVVWSREDAAVAA